MKSIEERIVEMQFDNRQFEKGAKESINTLKELNKSLDLEGASKNLKNLQKAGQDFSLEKVAKNIDDLSSRFSTFGIIGMTVLQDITRSAISSGKKIMEALTIEAPKMGFSEYETQINAIQTILANTQSKGTTLDEINDALDTLNKYADLTIYNFTQMTENIGRFTATGLELDLSTVAIKGMSNLAAMAGSTAAQLNTAMYQLSQGLSAGVIKLQDWNSLRNANITNESFRNSLIETAKVHGIAIDQMIAKYGSLEYSLQSGWLTSEIMMETLLKFSNEFTEAEWIGIGYTEEQAKAIIKLGETAMGAATEVKTFTQLIDTTKEALQSGWTQSWEIIIGDFDEAKALFSEISSVLSSAIEESATARNTMLESWKALGGRTAIIDSVRNVFTALYKVITPIKEAFSEIFPPVTGRVLASLSKSLRSFTENLIITDEQSNAIKMVFTGLFSIIKTGINIVTNFVSSLSPLIGIFGLIFNAVSDAVTGIYNFISGVSNTGNNIKASISIFTIIQNTISGIVTYLNELYNSFKQNIDLSWVNNISGAIAKVLSSIIYLKNMAVDAFTSIGNTAKNKLAPVNSIIEKLESVVNSVKAAFASFKAKVEEFVSPIATKIKNAFEGVTIVDIIGTGSLTAIAIFIKKIVDKVKDVSSSIGSVFTSINETLDTVRESLEAWQKSLKADMLLKIAEAVGILTLSLIGMSFIDGDKLKAGLSGVSVLLAEVVGTLIILDKLNIKGMAVNIGSIIAVSLSIVALTGALVKLKDFKNIEEIIPAILGVGAVMAALSKTITSISGTSIASAGKIAVVVLSLAASMKIFASAINDLSGLSLGQAVASVLSVGAILNFLAGFFSSIDGTKISGIAITLISLSASIYILTSAIEKMGELSSNFGAFASGLASIIALIVSLSVSIKLIGTANISGVAITLLSLAVSINILYKAVNSFGELFSDTTTFAAGIVSVAGLIAALTGSMWLIGTANISGVAITLLSLAVSINILYKAVASFAELSSDFASFAAGLSAVAALIVALTGSIMLIGTTSITGVAGTLIALSASLLVLAVPVRMLGSMPWQALALGIGSLFVTLAGVGAISALLTPFAAGMLSVAGAIAVFGAATLAIGAGVALLAAGLGVLATSAVAGASALVVAIPIVGQALAGLIQTSLEVIQNTAPAIMQTIAILIEAAIETLVKYGPSIAAAGWELFKQILHGIVLVAEELWPAIKELGGMIISGIGNFFSPMVEAGKNLVQGLINGILSMPGAIWDAVSEFGSSVLNGLREVLGIHSPSEETFSDGVNTVAGFVNGITSSLGSATKAGEGIGTSMGNGMNNRLADILSSASKLGSGFSNSVASGIKKNKTPEEIAEEKAKEIKEAFSKELNKIDLDIETSQLELELWETQNEQVLDEQEHYMKQKEQLNEEISLQTDKVAKANEKYLKMVETFGESSEYAQEAYNEWLEEQKKLAELSNELADLIEENSENIIETYEKMNEAIDRQMSKNNINEQIGDQMRAEVESLKDAKEEVKRLEEELDAGWEEYYKIKEEYADDPETMQEQLDAITPDLYQTQEDYYAALEKVKELEPKTAIKNFTETARSMREYYLQAEKVNIALKKYNALVADTEADQSDIEQAYNDYLQTRLDLINISSDYAETLDLDENGKIILNSFANALGENWYLVSDELGELLDSLESVFENSNLPEFAKNILSKFFDDPSLATLLSASLSELLKMVFSNIDIGSILTSFVSMISSGNGLSTIVSGFTSLFSFIPEIFSGLGAAVTGIVETVGPALLGLVSSAGPVGIAIAVIGALGVAFAVAWSKSEKFRDFVTNAFTKIKEVLVNVFEAIKVAAVTTFKIMLSPITAIVEAIRAIIDGLKKLLGFINDTEVVAEGEVNVESGSAASSGESIGSSLVGGFVDGMKNMASALLNPIGYIGSMAINGFKKVFDINSPSKVTAELGKMIVLGFNEGIEKNTSSSVYATEEYGKNIFKSLSNTFSNLDDLSEPTIRPVMDLSNVRKGAAEVDSLISRNSTYNLSDSAVRRSRKAIASVENQNGDDSSNIAKTSGTSYNFTQNNYSPKALSKSEIYRQTRNQFSTLKGLVEN